MILVLTLMQLIQMTGLSFDKPITIGDRDLCETFAVVAPADLRPQEARRLLFSALSGHGYTLVPVGTELRVKRARFSCYSEEKVSCQPSTTSFQTVVLRLRGSAEEAKEKLNHMVSRDGAIDAIPETNSLVISDYAENISKIVEKL